MKKIIFIIMFPLILSANIRIKNIHVDGCRVTRRTAEKVSVTVNKKIVMEIIKSTDTKPFEVGKSTGTTLETELP